MIDRLIRKLWNGTRLHMTAWRILRARQYLLHSHAQAVGKGEMERDLKKRLKG